jgi:hypothetical protein
LFLQPFLLGGGAGPSYRREKELASLLIAELMDEDTKTTGGIAEASGGLSRGNTVDKEGPEGFVLSMRGVGRLKKPLGKRCPFTGVA